MLFPMLNTGGKYDTKAFKKSVGLNGVGAKAVNALSSRFVARSVRDGQMREAVFNRETDKRQNSSTDEENGTYIFFEPDKAIVPELPFPSEFIETMLRNYTYLNTGLSSILL